MKFYNNFIQSIRHGTACNTTPIYMLKLLDAVPATTVVKRGRSIPFCNLHISVDLNGHHVSSTPYKAKQAQLWAELNTHHSTLHYYSKWGVPERQLQLSSSTDHDKTRHKQMDSECGARVCMCVCIYGCMRTTLQIYGRYALVQLLSICLHAYIINGTSVVFEWHDPVHKSELKEPDPTIVV